MIRRFRPHPPRTWFEIVQAAGGRYEIEAPATEASTAVDRAHEVDRNTETCVELLAAIERDVSDTGTRERLDEFLGARLARRAESLELEDQLDDMRTTTERVVDNLWAGTWSIALLLALLPFPSADIPSALGAVAATIALVGAIAAHAERSTFEPEWRRMLLTIAALTLIAPLSTAIRILILIPENFGSYGTTTVVGLSVQVASAFLLTVLALFAGSAARVEARRARTPDSPRKAGYQRQVKIEERLRELDDSPEEDDIAALRDALADRDPAVARSTRHTIVEAIRALHERGEIDCDEAEWMLREALH